jgi:hypothetical protein
VPVTGGDLDALNMQDDLAQSIFLKLGAAFLGLAMVLHGIDVRRNRINGKSITETGERRSRPR